MRLSVLAALVACTSPGTRRVMIVKRIPNQPDLDLLFVIDNSASTADKQALFAANWPRFVQALDAFPAGRPNLHIGVVSTTVGIGSTNFGAGCASPNDDGVLQTTPRISGCLPPLGHYISDLGNSDGTRTINYSENLDQELPCIATLGTTGCGFEAPLEAMKRAVDGSRTENAGFLRDDADLGIIILTDEDDCSVRDPSLFALNDVGPGDFRCQPMFAYDCDQPISATTAGTYTSCTTRVDSYLQTPQWYVDFLTTIKDRSQIAIGLIAGDPTSTIQTGPISTPFSQALALEPSRTNTSTGPPSIGRPGDRLADFTSRFGDRGTFHSVCANDYSPALADIGHTLFTMMSKCLEGPIDMADTDASNPGLQPACTVTDQPLGLVIPACDMLDPITPDPASPRPCAWFVPSAVCTTDTGIEVRVERTGPAPAGGVLQVSCAPRP